jgi:hypothetical protein
MLSSMPPDDAKEFMFSHLKSLFSLLQCIDVRKRRVPLNNVSSIITERETAIQEPVIGSIDSPVICNYDLSKFGASVAITPAGGRFQQFDPES